MKRIWFAALSILFGSICALYYHARVGAAGAGEYDNFTAWVPNVQTVRLRLSGDTKQSPSNVEAHRQTFSELLTQRFRNRDKAVKIKFKYDLLTNQDRIMLMCPARMEPWNMDLLAVKTWQEAKDDLGVSYPLDIYITYIGLSRIKVAELRPVAGNTAKVAIRYWTPARIRREMNGDQTAADSESGGMR